MDYFTAKIDQLVVESQKNKKFFIRSFISKVPVQLEKSKGRLFGLIEINSTDPKIPELIDLIVGELKNNYYSADDSSSDGYDTETLFESVLQKTNLSIAAFLESERITLDLTKMNIMIGTIVNHDLFFTQIGNINIFLLQYLRRKEFRIIDILEVTKTPITTPNPLKLFSQVITGRLGLRDVLFVTTNNLLDYFSLERIKNVVIDNPGISDGINELSQSISEINVEKNFGIIISEIEKISVAPKIEPQIQKFDYQKAASQDSIRELIRTEKETEKLLTPSILPEVKKYGRIFSVAFQNYLSKIKNTSLSIPKTKKNISLPRLPHLNIKNKLSKNIRSLRSFSNPIKRGVNKINFSGMSSFRQKIWYVTKMIVGRIWSAFMRLPNPSKIFLVVSVILAFLFLQNIIFTGIKNQKEKIVTEFNQAFSSIESKKNEAEASLIYRDENQARALLVEAKNAIAGLEPKSENQRERIQTLKIQIEESLEKLQHLINIEEPVLIANFQNLDAQADIAPLGMIVRNTFYTQNRRSQSIYKANLSARTMSGIYSENLSSSNFILGTIVSDNELIFLSENKKTFLVNPSNDSINDVLLDLSIENKINDIAAYNSRLYILDSGNNQIYRYSKIIGGYGNIQEWVDPNQANLSNASSLAVDGSIYVLKNNGEIIKLENGRKVEFESTIVDPAIQSPSKIKTADTSNYLYILDPPTKRLVVISKNGNLAAQYTSKKFDDLKDFTVSESEKKIFILNGSSIFGIPADHL